MAAVRSRVRVAVDATPLLGHQTGVGVFCRLALGALAARSDVDVGAFAVSWRRRRRIRPYLPAGVRVLDRPMPARPLHAAWSRAEVPPVELWTGATDVVHGTNFVVPPAWRAARVVTVHDLTSVRFPELCDDDTRAYPRLIQRAVDQGAWVHTPSRFVAGEVVEAFRVPVERVRAVHHGVPPMPADVPPGPPARLPAEATTYVLAVGTVEPRKDLPGLVRAFDLVAGDHPEVWLVVAGADGWGAGAYRAAVDAATHRHRIVRLGYVSEAERSALLRSATVYAYPSIYEGFGLPPLEAMQAGVPVVTSRAGALPEVTGDAAVTVDAGDAGDLAVALGRLLEDDDLRSDMIRRGRRHAACFDWADTAAGLAALYADAVAAR